MKKIVLSVLVILTCLSLVACGTQQEVKPVETPVSSVTGQETSAPDVIATIENNVEEEPTETNGDATEAIDYDNIDLYSDDTKMVFTVSDTVSGVYYHDGEKITGYEVYAKYDTPALAEAAKLTYDDSDENIESMTVKGNYLVVKYKESEYENQSLEELKQSFAILELLKGQ